MPDALDAYVADEIRTHGAVRPPYVAFPGVHPFDVFWRMGAGESHVMALSRARSSLGIAERDVVVKRSGAVPADWVWWVADWLALFPEDASDAEASETFGAYDHAFDDVRARLATRGISVTGEPEEERDG